MIDPVQLPILMKAIDFVFDEGRKILEERREHRKHCEAAPNPAGSQATPEPELPEPAKAQAIKQDLIASKIDELLWQNHEAEIQHLVRLLEKHTQNYYILKEQYAQFGSAFAPPYVVSQMQEKEEAIRETRQQLEGVLSKVYKKDLSQNQ